MKSTIYFILITITLITPHFGYAQCGSGDTTYLDEQGPVLEYLDPLPGDMTHHNKTAADTNERVIFFIPGLGGDENAWSDVYKETSTNQDDEYPGYPARKVHVKDFSEKGNPGYIEDGLVLAALNVYGKMKAIDYQNLGVENIGDNIVIAHSQGGLVTRATDRLMRIEGRTPQFGGVVTFGSPHQGAEILTNGLPVSKGGRGMIPKFATELCTDLSAGPIWDEMRTNSSFVGKMIRLFDMEQTIVDLSESLCRVIGDSILPQFILPDLTPPITEDYFAHNEYYNEPNYLLNDLNNYQPTIPMVAFYGVEEEPVVWRQLGSIATGVHTYPAFQADPDQEFADIAADFQATYWSKYISYKNLAAHHKNVRDNYYDAAKWVWFFRLHLLVAGAIHDDAYWEAVNARNAFKRGYTFLYEANDKWKTIIGARKTKQIITQTIVCRCSDKCNGGWDSEFTVNNHIECLERDLDDECLECSPATYSKVVTVPTYKESDGVVLAESARGLPGAIVNPNLSDNDYKLTNTNHQQLRNSSETARKLNRLFNTDDYSNFFITDTR